MEDWGLERCGGHSGFMMTGGPSAEPVESPKLCDPDLLSPHLRLLQAKGLLWRSGAAPTVVCTDGVCRLVRPGQGSGVSHEKWMRHMSQRGQLGPAGKGQSSQQPPPEGSEEQTGELLPAVEHTGLGSCNAAVSGSPGELLLAVSLATALQHV